MEGSSGKTDKNSSLKCPILVMIAGGPYDISSKNFAVQAFL